MIIVDFDNKLNLHNIIADDDVFDEVDDVDDLVDDVYEAYEVFLGSDSGYIGSTYNGFDCENFGLYGNSVDSDLFRFTSDSN